MGGGVLFSLGFFGLLSLEVNNVILLGCLIDIEGVFLFGFGFGFFRVSVGCLRYIGLC
jgi:hypothetical protein